MIHAKTMTVAGLLWASAALANPAELGTCTGTAADGTQVAVSLAASGYNNGFGGVAVSVNGNPVILLDSEGSAPEAVGWWNSNGLTFLRLFDNPAQKGLLNVQIQWAKKSAVLYLHYGAFNLDAVKLGCTATE